MCTEHGDDPRNCLDSELENDTIQNMHIRPSTKVEDILEYLSHACQCRNAAACTERSCVKMKVLLKHVKSCKKSNKNCSPCKQVISVCCYHAKRCKKDHCPVPFCFLLRQKFADQLLAESRRSDMMMRRRMGAIGVEDEVLQQNEKPSA